jgi:hypothetical protein
VILPQSFLYTLGGFVVAMRFITFFIMVHE